MGLLGSKRSSAEDQAPEATAARRNLGQEHRLVTTREKITYLNQSLGLLMNSRALPDFILVKNKKTSLWMDEDGWTANEFYEQVADQDDESRTRLVRKTKSLTRLDVVPLKWPRLNSNVNIVLWEEPKSK